MSALGAPWAAEPATGRVFGTELVLELAGCNPKVTGDPDALVLWTRDLCRQIGMLRHGRPMVEHFGVGDLAGWTVVQLITTSSITVHAVDSDRSAFVNVFSCRPFDTDTATRFTVERFDAQAVSATVLVRRVPA